ncbi:MAG: LytTR family DNA-binding domain-containing protein [Kiritimatiellae bacterium]|nr:LytTR family DNA-binding domain-containing protein [Kiritimatiellia bacterium]
MVIIDDERRARKALASLLDGYDFVTLCGEAASADEGIRIISETAPDIIFLDIQMPRKSGFDLLEELETDASVIFVTAYDQYAIRAFEVNAVDYLLKPVLPERLEQALQRITGACPPTEPQKLIPEDSVRIHTDRKTIFRDIDGLLAIQSDGDYTQAFFKDTQYLVSQTMNEWENRLPGQLFSRIDRSLIINHRKIDELEIKNRNLAYLHIKNCPRPFQLGRTALKRIRELAK